MAFYTKVDYSRQLRQNPDTSVVFSGSSTLEQNLYVERCFKTHVEGWYDDGTCSCGECTTGYTFMVGSYSATSGSCNVTVTPFSGVSGNSVVLAVGQVPKSPISGGTSNPGISASTIQINRGGLMDATGSYNDVSIDTSGNLVKAASSSKRYKTNLISVESGRYLGLLKLVPYHFTYKSSGIGGFGLIAEDLHALGYNELVMYDGEGRPDNIHYKLLSVALLQLIKDIRGDINVDELSSITNINERDSITKVVSNDYKTNGEYLIVVTSDSTITLDSSIDTKIKIKSLANTLVLPDKGLIDNKWENIELDGDSSVEFVFVSELNYWVIVSSDGIKNS